MAPRGTILVVDDEVDILEMIEVGLEAERYNVLLANSGADAVAMFEAQRPHLVICDIKMPGLDGVATVTRLRQLDPNLPAIMLSGYLTQQTIEECQQLGSIQLIRKPFAFSELSNLVASSLSRLAH